MFPITARLIKYISLPVLLIASALPFYAASYQTAVNLVICLGALVAVLRSVVRREYFWAAGFLAIAIVFSPLLMAFKIFFLIGLACSAALGSVVAAFLPLPVIVLSTTDETKQERTMTNGPAFRGGDEVVLTNGAYPGTRGTFLRLKRDAKWADIAEGDGRVRSHPVAWLAHATGGIPSVAH